MNLFKSNLSKIFKVLGLVVYSVILTTCGSDSDNSVGFATGSCSGTTILSIWSGNQLSSTDNSKYLGDIVAYTDTAENPKSPSENYNHKSASVNLTYGPTATADHGSVFFYYEHTDPTQLYFFYFFGVEGGNETNTVNWDILTVNNSSLDGVMVTDDKNEAVRIDQVESNGKYASTYKGRYWYKKNSDGAVLGPFTGRDFRIYVRLTGESSLTGDTLGLGGLDSMKYYSSDGQSISLGDKGEFTIGYMDSVSCTP